MNERRNEREKNTVCSWGCLLWAAVEGGYWLNEV